MIKKEIHEDFVLELKEEAMEDYLNKMIKNAEYLTQDFKNELKRFKEPKSQYSTKEDIIQEAMNTAQQVSWHFDEGAYVIRKYMEAKIRREFAKKQA